MTDANIPRRTRVDWPLDISGFAIIATPYCRARSSTKLQIGACWSCEPTILGVRLCWELKNLKGLKRLVPRVSGAAHFLAALLLAPLSLDRVDERRMDRLRNFRGTAHDAAVHLPPQLDVRGPGPETGSSWPSWPRSSQHAAKVNPP